MSSYICNHIYLYIYLPIPRRKDEKWKNKLEQIISEFLVCPLDLLPLGSPGSNTLAIFCVFRPILWPSDSKS